MLNSERINLCKALVKLNTYTNTHVRKYDLRTGRQVETFNLTKGRTLLHSILKHDLTSIKGASEIMQKLVNAIKHNADYWDYKDYISDLILLLSPTMTIKQINKSLDKIQNNLAPNNVKASMDKLINLYMNSDWHDVINLVDKDFGVSHYTLKKDDTSLNDVIKAGMKGNISPTKYAKLYSQFKNSYPYYKTQYNQTYPITTSDIKDLISLIKSYKHYLIGAVNEYTKARKNLMIKAVNE